MPILDIRNQYYLILEFEELTRLNRTLCLSPPSLVLLNASCSY